MTQPAWQSVDLMAMQLVIICPLEDQFDGIGGKRSQQKYSEHLYLNFKPNYFCIYEMRLRKNVSKPSIF